MINTIEEVVIGHSSNVCWPSHACSLTLFLSIFCSIRTEFRSQTISLWYHHGRWLFVLGH